MIENPEFQETHFKASPLSFDDEGVCWLESRYLNSTAAFKCGIRAIGGWVSFPYFKNGQLVRWKHRSMANKKEQSWSALPENEKKDWKAPFFNQQNWSTKDYLIITEGELDCAALVKLGATNVVSLPNGSSSVESTFKNNYEYLQSYEIIYIAFDMDEAGNKACDKAMSMLSYDRYRRIHFPSKEDWVVKDANDWIQAFNPTIMDLIELVRQATRPESDCIKHISECPDSVFEAVDIGTTTGISSLDCVIGGLRKGDLIVISADTGAGKTTFCLNMLYNLSKYGRKCWINSYEMADKTIYRKIASIILKKIMKLDPFTKIDREKFKHETEKNNLYVNPKSRGNTLLELKCNLEKAALAYGIEYVLIDHLDYKLFAKGTLTTAESIKEVMRNLHEWAMELNICILLVVHPSKIDISKELTKQDLKGSSSIAQYADIILLLSRLQDNKVNIRIDKNRLMGVETNVIVRYEPGSDSYSEIPGINFHKGTYND